jgi:hypothetical protein
VNVLVTCGGSVIVTDVLAQLRRISEVAAVVLVDAQGIDFDHGCATARVPPGNSPDYAEALRAIVDRHDVGFIFVASDEESLALSRCEWARRISHLDTLENTSLVLDKYTLHATLQAGADPPVVPDFRLCRTRGELAAMLAEHGSVVARPVRGRGSKGLSHIVPDDGPYEFPQAVPLAEYRMPSNGDATFYAAYLPGDKYSADCLFDGGSLLACMMRNNGPAVKYRPPTMQAVTTDDQDVHAFADRTGRTLGLSGFHQIECGRAADGTVRLIEINPRLDATLPITQCYAENFYEILMHPRAVGLMRPRTRFFRRFFTSYSK